MYETLNQAATRFCQEATRARRQFLVHELAPFLPVNHKNFTAFAAQVDVIKILLGMRPTTSKTLQVTLEVLIQETTVTRDSLRSI